MVTNTCSNSKHIFYVNRAWNCIKNTVAFKSKKIIKNFSQCTLKMYNCTPIKSNIKLKIMYNIKIKVILSIHLEGKK